MISTFLKRSKALSCALVLVLVVPAAGQQTGSSVPAPGPPTGTSAPAFTPEQLEQIAAPVALYPDPLLAQVLMASTYPLEVVQAARFVKDHQDLKGDQLNEKLKDQSWDDSVKSLVSFPEVLSLMDGKLDWTQQLGDATIGQEKELMDAIQRLRARAQAQGNLKSTQEQTVTVEPAPPAAPGQATPAQQTIVIQPASPDVVYVPSYNPTVVYGSWPYPAYPPAYPYPPGYAFGGALLSFGIGMAVGGALWGNCNWGGGNVDVNVNRNENFSRNVNRSNVSSERVSQYRQGQSGNRSQWSHNPQHRQGVQYRDSASQQKYNRGSNAQAVQSRENFRGRAEQGRQDLGRGGGQGFGGAGAQRAGGAGGQGFGGGGREAGAFQGMGGGSGGNVRADSNRGAASRQSMGAGASRGGGGAASRPSGGGGASRGGGGGGRGGGRR